MEIINLSEHNSIINRYLAEMRDCDYQKNRLLFRNNIKRIGEYEAFDAPRKKTEKHFVVSALNRIFAEI